MHLRSLRKLAIVSLLAFVALAACSLGNAQALHPLPANMLATLRDIDNSADEMTTAVKAIRKADLTYSMFSRNRVEDAITRMEQQVPAMKAQTADLRREESLRVLMSMRTAFSEAQRNIGSISDILHGVTVRTPVQAAELDKLLASLDGATARLDTALKRFDTGAALLTARASAEPATTLTPAGAPTMAGPNSSASEAPRAALALPPDLIATLGDVDTCSEELATAVKAIKSADLTYSMFSQRRIETAIANMEQQVPPLKAQTADLRRTPSLGKLLSIRTTFSSLQRGVGSVTDILHGATVRTPAQAEQLDKLLARLDGAVSRLDAALKRFDSRALAAIDLLDRPSPNKPAR